jgi:hypothetical protein
MASNETIDTGHTAGVVSDGLLDIQLIMYIH